MCGIFGVVAVHGNLTPRQQDFITAGTITGQLRGEDGTGWILNNRNSGTRVFKRAICGSDFLGTRQGAKAIKQLSTSNVVIGHNRKTTSGGDNDGDCHPFNYKSVVGVHNGGVGKVVLDRLNIAGAVADVDSAKIYAAIEDADDPLDVLAKIHTGSYALVWIDKAAGDVCFARNKDRPLWAASSPAGLYFASEPGMLFWLMTRYGLQHKDSKIYEMQPNHLYRIPMKNPLDVKRVAYTSKGPVYKAPINNAHHSRHSTGWYANANYAGDNTVHKFVGGTGTLANNFPQLRHVADIIDSNYDIIHRDEGGDKNALVPSRRLDVIITKVTQRKNSTNKEIVDMIGYVYDETNAETIIPCSILSVKDEGEVLHTRYVQGIKNKKLFTVRGVVRNIRVCADTTVCLAMGLTSVWDNQSDEPITEDGQLSALEVDDAVADKFSRFTSIQLTSMWDKLRKTTALAPVTTVH